MAAGAILVFGVDWHVKGVNLDVVGVILMLVGLIGVLAFTSIYKRRKVPPPSPEGDRGHEYRIIE